MKVLSPEIPARGHRKARGGSPGPSRCPAGARRPWKACLHRRHPSALTVIRAAFGACVPTGGVKLAPKSFACASIGTETAAQDSKLSMAPAEAKTPLAPLRPWPLGQPADGRTRLRGRWPGRGSGRPACRGALE
ncbi:MAG: hypothetical protein IK061_01325, partial [Desulfovibrio sp.]|nr:hypothetical protein [Desulfovibrio sp.]